MRLRNLCLALAAGSVLTGCDTESLGVENVDQPDVAQSLSTAAGIQAIIQNGFNQIYQSTTGSGTIVPAAEVFAFESYGSVANFGMNLRSAIPRTPIDNQRGNATKDENFSAFSNLSLRARTVGNAIIALDKLVENSGSLGSPSQNARAKAFGFFVLALANGELAMAYDSSAVITTDLPSDSTPPLTGYQESMATALAQIDSALAYTAQAAGGDGFPIDGTWIRTPSASTSAADFTRILHSLRARLRAGVARTPEERAAVDWGAVAADAADGIQSDVVLALKSSDGWGHGWLSQAYVDVSWHQMPNFIIGMADTSGGYASWLAAPLNARTPFLIQTPDTRFPSGNDRATQVANSPSGTTDLPSIYFRNRPAGQDIPGQPYGDSFYDVVRFRSYRQNNSEGQWVWFSATENAMLRAEALIRTNQANLAMPIINASRTAHGLAAFTSPDGTAPDCVPRTPTGTNGALQCATLMEAMKWEKRMETAFTGFIQWYIDSRGWGDLAVDTPIDWPTPYQEMDARRLPFYNSQRAAGPSNYKFY